MSDAMSDGTAGSEREPDEREPVDRDVDRDDDHDVDRDDADEREPVDRDVDRDDDHDDEVAGQPLRVDPDAPGRSLFEDGDAVEPNEPA
jgi:hypothetical protein